MCQFIPSVCVCVCVRARACVGSSFSWVRVFNSWKQQNPHSAINTLWGRWG
jgi:hypothetical protein